MIPDSVNYELVLKKSELGLQLKPVIPALRRQDRHTLQTSLGYHTSENNLDDNSKFPDGLG